MDCVRGGFELKSSFETRTVADALALLGNERSRITLFSVGILSFVRIQQVGPFGGRFWKLFLSGKLVFFSSTLSKEMFYLLGLPFQ